MDGNVNMTPFFASIRKQILINLKKATNKISVAVCWFTNSELLEVLCAKLDANVQVELIILDDYINSNPYGCDFHEFIIKGGEMYMSSVENPMHNKYCIIDNKVLITGSYNWTYFAETKNDENIIVFKKNPELIAAFNDDFDRLKSKTDKIEVFRRKPLAYFEQSLNNISIQNAFSAKNMLSNDLFIKAVETNNKHYYEAATNIIPDNVQWQKKAVELKWDKPMKLKQTISEGIVNDNIIVIFPLNTTIPAESSNTYCTIADKQQIMICSILSGENLIASKNKLLRSFTITDIPSLNAGEAQFPTEYKLTIDGKLHIKKYIHDTGRIDIKIIELRALGLLENV